MCIIQIKRYREANKMKAVYPVIFTKLEDGFMAYVPDFEINTQGDTLAEAIEMARDAIGIMGIDKEDEGQPLPQPSATESIAADAGALLSMVDIDFSEYRRKNDLRTVRRNVTLPSWLNEAANEANLNVSAVLQAALKRELNI